MSQSRLDEQNIWTVLDKLLLSVNNSRKGGRQKIVFNITEIFKYWETTLCIYIHCMHILYIFEFCGFKKNKVYCLVQKWIILSYYLFK